MVVYFIRLTRRLSALRDGVKPQSFWGMRKKVWRWGGPPAAFMPCQKMNHGRTSDAVLLRDKSYHRVSSGVFGAMSAEGIKTARKSPFFVQKMEMEESKVVFKPRFTTHF